MERRGGNGEFQDLHLRLAFLTQAVSTREPEYAIHEAFGYSNGDWEIFDAEGGQGIYGCEELHYGLGFVGDAFEEWQGH